MPPINPKKAMDRVIMIISVTIGCLSMFAGLAIAFGPIILEEQSAQPQAYEYPIYSPQPAKPIEQKVKTVQASDTVQDLQSIDYKKLAPSSDELVKENDIYIHQDELTFKSHRELLRLANLIEGYTALEAEQILRLKLDDENLAIMANQPANITQSGSIIFDKQIAENRQNLITNEIKHGVEIYNVKSPIPGKLRISLQFNRVTAAEFITGRWQAIK